MSNPTTAEVLRWPSQQTCVERESSVAIGRASGADRLASVAAGAPLSVLHRAQPLCVPVEPRPSLATAFSERRVHFGALTAAP